MYTNQLRYSHLICKEDGSQGCSRPSAYPRPRCPIQEHEVQGSTGRTGKSQGGADYDATSIEGVQSEGTPLTF